MDQRLLAIFVGELIFFFSVDLIKSTNKLDNN